MLLELMEKSKRTFRRRSAPAEVLSKPGEVAFDKPVETELPCQVNLVNHLGLDEFFFFESKLSVQKTLSNKNTSSRVPIGKACENLKKKHPTARNSSCYTLDLSSDTELDGFIDIPQIVTDHSLFHQHWPTKRNSIFFLQRSKLYHAFQDKYKSFPYLAYGGLTEWIHVLRGKLSVTVIEPTDLNLARLECLDEGEELVIEPGTYREYILKEDSFLSIPTGRISIKKAIKPTCALGGEILHSDDLPNQLESFKRDMRQSNGRYAFQRDLEIRHLYWFYSIHVLSISNNLEGMNLPNIQALMRELSDWAQKSKIAITKEDPYATPDLYAPMGIQINGINRDFRNRHRHRKDSLLGINSRVRDGNRTTSPSSKAIVVRQ